MNQQGRKYKTVSGALLSLLISCCLLSSVKAQTAEQLVAFAKEQMLEGNYEQAGNALSRVFWFDNGVRYPEVLPLLADNAYLSADFGSARYYYELSYNQENNDSLKTEYFLKKVLCSIQLGNYPEAMGDLYSTSVTADSLQQWNLDLITGMALYKLEKFDESKGYFLRCAAKDQQERIIQEFSRIRKIERRYSPRLAGIMSIVIPGSGQVYCGDYKNGINSFLLLAGLISSGVLLAGPYTVIDASIIVLPWFQRYYIGGYQKAALIAADRQNEKKSSVLINILHTLQ